MEKRKEKAGATWSFMYLLIIMFIMILVTMYMVKMAELMTNQHAIDDALADAVLASLVADDELFFETKEEAEKAEEGEDVDIILKLDDNDRSYALYKECMEDAVAGQQEFFHNLHYDTFIEYEVMGDVIQVTEYASDAGIKSISYGSLGAVSTPTGRLITETGAYAKVSFDIEGFMGNGYLTKTRDIYCTLKINEEE